MAIDKDPSIYRDRGMIGSSDELDEYGVWVKSEPEDIASAPATPIEEPTLPDIEDLPDLELDSTETFDFAGLENEAAAPEADAEPRPLKMETAKADLSVADGGEISGEALPSFEDIASFEADMPPVSNEDFTELSMDDFLDVGSEETGTKASPAVEDETLDIDLDFKDTAEPQLDHTAEADFDFQVEDDEPKQESAKGEAIALETVSDFDDFLNDLSGTEGAAEAAPSAESVEGTTPTSPLEGLEESEDISIDVEESEPVATTFESVEDSEDIALSAMDGDIGTTEEASAFALDLSAPEVEVEQAAAEESFDDVAALSRELSESDSREAPAANAGLSTQLLMRIADELSSIKTELSSLKEELSVLRGEVKSEQPEEKEPQASHGFFDEEDDEKIALTGDELDNILNTADFTEEAGADATADMSDEAVIDDFLMDREDLLGNAAEGVAASAGEEPIMEEIPVEEITTDTVAASEAAAEAGIERIDLEEAPLDAVPEELQELQVSGVSPMTPPPEDTSYLEADDLATADIDLSEAVIDEPDLGGPVLEENPVEEPSMEAIHLDLEMEEALHVEGEESLESESGAGFENIELTLDEFIGDEQGKESSGGPGVEEMELETTEEMTPVAEESFAEVVPEGFVVEPEETSMPMADGDQAETIETVELTEEPSEEAEPLPVDIRQEVRAVLSYMDQLLESLPEDKIEEFAKSDYFDTYKKLFEELGLV